jgi:hypothetical protein
MSRTRGLTISNGDAEIPASSANARLGSTRFGRTWSGRVPLRVLIAGEIAVESQEIALALNLNPTAAGARSTSVAAMTRRRSATRSAPRGAPHRGDRSSPRRGRERARQARSAPHSAVGLGARRSERQVAREAAAMTARALGVSMSHDPATPASRCGTGGCSTGEMTIRETFTSLAEAGVAVRRLTEAGCRLSGSATGRQTAWRTAAPPVARSRGEP